MNYKVFIQRSLDFIEENLCNDITMEQAAECAGYSKYHFTRIFHDTMGMTPGDYIRKRRLSEIAREMMKSGAASSELAFMYGFNSKENFIRAFKNEHGITPSSYRESRNSLRLFPRVNLFTSPAGFPYEMTWLPEITIQAYKSDEAVPSKFWNKYNCRKWSDRLSGGQVSMDYGISIFRENTLEYYIGIPAEMAKGDLEGTYAIPLSAGPYAVFETPHSSHFSFVATIQDVWKYINSCWELPVGFRRGDTPSFENYLESGRTFSEKIYIPLKEDTS